MSAPGQAGLSSNGAAQADRAKRVYVVEDHALMRKSIVAALEREPVLLVCGEADDVTTALDGISASHPDAVLTDLELKSSSGLDLIRQLSLRAPGLPVVATTMFNLGLNERLARAAGARAFVAKQDGPEKMLQAVRHVLQPG